MSPEIIALIISSVFVTVLVGSLFIRKTPKRIVTVKYTEKWRSIQKLCADRATWPEAIIKSDELLDEVMRRKKIKGKTFGERLVSVRDRLGSNDQVWNAHKLANHIRHSNDPKLKEKDVKQALTGFRQALRDLGAL